MVGSVRELVRALRAQGWRVEVSGGGHYRCEAPSGALVFMPATPSDGRRGMRNTLAVLRRAGAVFGKERQ